MLHRIRRYLEILFLNPKVFFQKAIWLFLKEVAPSPKGVVQAKIGGYCLDTLPSRHRFWKSMYYGYCDVEIEHNIKKYLGTGGVFIDVGAGVGYFSAIASEIVGIAGEVHYFEPFLSNSAHIRRMIDRKPSSNIILNDFALGDDDKVQDFYLNRDVRGWESSMIKDFIKKVDEVLKVRTRRLDTYLGEKNIDTVSLIKIDVEGYEYYVLRGLAGFLERTTCKPPIICEISVPACDENRPSLTELHDYMSGYGYQAYNIFSIRKRVDIRQLSEMADVVFLSTR